MFSIDLILFKLVNRLNMKSVNDMLILQAQLTLPTNDLLKETSLVSALYA